MFFNFILSFNILYIFFTHFPIIDGGISESDKYKLLKDDVFQNISKELYNNVKIFCIVLTKPEHRTRVNALRATWLKRCNKYKHIVTGKTKKNKKGKRQTVYTPIKNILITTIKQLQKEYTNEIDWFLFVDDTSYVVMENLRYMLYKYNPEEVYGVGFDIKSSSFIKSTGTLLSHGSYLLSIGALDKIVSKVIPNIKECSSTDDEKYDFGIYKCLYYIKLRHIDPKDKFGYERIIKSSLIPNSERCEYVDSEAFQALGRTLLTKPTYAEYPISFHNIRNDAQYALEYFLYHASVIGKQSSLFKKIYEKYYTTEELKKAIIGEIVRLAPIYVMES